MNNKIERIRIEADSALKKKLEETEATKTRIETAEKALRDAERALKDALTEGDYIEADTALKDANRQISINSELLRKQKSAFDLPGDKYEEYAEELLKQHSKNKEEAQKSIRALAIKLCETIELYAKESEELLSVLNTLDAAAGKTNMTAAPSIVCYLGDLKQDASGSTSSIYDAAVRFFNLHPLPETVTPPAKSQREPAMRRFIKNGEVTLISEEEYNQDFKKRYEEAERKRVSNVQYL